MTVPASRCAACDALWVPPRQACPACGGDVRDATSASSGRVASWTRVMAAPAGEEPGYVLALVELDGGATVLARGAPSADVRTGDRVTVTVDDDRVAFTT